jgi:hypothetical protein
MVWLSHPFASQTRKPTGRVQARLLVERLEQRDLPAT